MKKKPASKEIDDILTLRQACELLNCHPNTLRNWDKKGLLKPIRIGTRRDRRYRKGDLLKLIQSN